MRRLSVILALLFLGGCATHQIKDYTEDERQKADAALAEYIKKNRQLVFMPGDWQVMAYCTESTVETAVKKGATILCKPPKTANTDVTMRAQVYVLLKKLRTETNRPSAWQARFDNFTQHDICLNTQWRLMDIKAQDQLKEWQVVPAQSRLKVGYLRQESWEFGAKTILLDFSGHVSGLLVRPVSNDGSCYEMAAEEPEK